MDKKKKMILAVVMALSMSSISGVSFVSRFPIRTFHKTYNPSRKKDPWVQPAPTGSGL